MSPLVLIDTLSWVQALRKSGDVAVRQRVEQLLNNRVAAWCEMVRLELWNGVRDDRERKSLMELDRKLPRLPITEVVWQAAAEYASLARANGYTIPASDVLIYACAKAFGVTVERADQHFDYLDKL